MRENEYLWCKALSLHPQDKILSPSKSKAFTVDKLKLAQVSEFVLDRTEYIVVTSIVGKGENAGNQNVFCSIKDEFCSGT